MLAWTEEYNLYKACLGGHTMPEIVKSQKKNYYPKYSRSPQHKIQGILTLFIIIAIISMLYIQLDRQIMPAVMAMAEMEAQTVATQAINEGITQSLLTNQTTMQDLISYDYNDSGELVSWNINSIMVNTLSASIAEYTLSELKQIGTIKFKIPLGNVTGSRIFANIGPEMSVNVLPVGTVSVDYENELRSTGINQVNHTVWLNVEATVQVVVPLFSTQTVVSRRVVLIDKVISGEVPPSYINIPEKNVTSALPAIIN